MLLSAISGCRLCISSFCAAFSPTIRISAGQRPISNSGSADGASRRKAPTPAGRSSRHFDFAGKEFWQVPAELASAMVAHVADAARVIESGALDKWLRRSLGDEDRADNVADAIPDLKDHRRTANFEEQLRRASAWPSIPPRRSATGVSRQCPPALPPRSRKLSPPGQASRYWPISFAQPACNQLGRGAKA